LTNSKTSNIILQQIIQGLGPAIGSAARSKQEHHEVEHWKKKILRNALVQEPREHRETKIKLSEAIYHLEFLQAKQRRNHLMTASFKNHIAKLEQKAFPTSD